MQDLNYSAVYKAFSFYKSCMNQSEIETKGRKPILDVIKNYGLWNISNGTWTNADSSWILEKVIARVLVDLGTQPFIGLDVTLSPFNTSQVVVQVSSKMLCNSSCIILRSILLLKNLCLSLLHVHMTSELIIITYL